jgi:hypothetical protein
LLERDHPFRPIEETMSITHTTGKGRKLKVIEKYYIYKETARNNQLNDRLTVTPNIIFDTFLRSVDTKTFHTRTLSLSPIGSCVNTTTEVPQHRLINHNQNTSSLTKASKDKIIECIQLVLHHIQLIGSNKNRTYI